MNELIKFPPRRDDQWLGQLLLVAGTISEKDLADALSEQANSGGKLDKILVANGVVDKATITNALARILALPTVVQAQERPRPLLTAQQARSWRAVVLSNEERAGAKLPLPV